MGVMLSKWESNVLWDTGRRKELHPLYQQIRMLEKDANYSKLPYRNNELDKWDLFEFVDPTRPYDPTLLPPPNELPVLSLTSRTLVINEKQSKQYAIDKFNLSNDSFYEQADKMLANTRNCNIVLQHSIPAQKLNLMFYKTELNAQELRRFHRERAQFLETEIKFTKVRQRKKKKGDLELLRDLSLRDNVNFTLFEYSEEIPLLLSNKGMASIIFNYYRRKDDKDTFKPVYDLGTVNVLKPNESGPFFGFGDLEKGEKIQVLFNNLFRAPIYRHETNDFLLICQQTKSRTRYFVREIPSIFVVGQCFPTVEIASPTSRVYTEYRRMRIRMIVYKLFKQRNLKDGIKFQELVRLFPHYADVQLKSRLKEFMEGRGLPSGHWRLKSDKIPNDEELLKMATPEQVCTYEAMMAGVRRQEDLKNAVGGHEHFVDKALLRLEDEMAPWKLTKNFSLSQANKKLVHLDGPGDCTGCGEGFSFIRAGTREKLKWSSHESRLTPHEQHLTISQILKDTWARQKYSLSSKIPPCSLFEHQEEGKKALTLKPKCPMLSPYPVKDAPYMLIRRKYGSEWREEAVRDPRIKTMYQKLKQRLQRGETLYDRQWRHRLMVESGISEQKIQSLLKQSRELKTRNQKPKEQKRKKMESDEEMENFQCAILNLPREMAIKKAKKYVQQAGEVEENIDVMK